MCGRFTLFTNLSELAERFGFDPSTVQLRKNFNVAPSQSVLTVVANPSGTALAKPEFMVWGLRPNWSSRQSTRPGIINARAETAAEKPSFRSSFRNKRCLVIADGFYEWLKTDSGKNPMRIQLKNGSPFAFAGLWNNGLDINGRAISTCTILTTASTTFMQPIHHRMPVILKRENEARWIDPKINSPSDIQSLIVQDPDTYLQSWQVSNLVNSPLNNDPKCLEAVI